MMEEDSGKKDYGEGSGRGYGRRPLWQWILIYAIVGFIIYGLIYYFAFYRQGSAEGPTGNPTPQIQFPGY